MRIRLSGLAFDTALIAELETNMLQNGFRLEDFAFAKQKHNRIPGASRGYVAEYDYTVSVSGKQFSIIFTDDFQFVRFFYNLCLSTGDDNPPHTAGSPLDALIMRAERTTEIIKHWLTEDPFQHHR